MKFFKSLLIFSFFLVVSQVEAQTTETFSGSDTVVNTATVDLTFKMKNNVQTASFQVVNTKVSGTVAGKSYLQASNDGSTYVTIDSLTNTNVATNSKLFLQNPAGYAYYRIRWTGTGTMAAITSATAYLKK